jgi:hypothetical protein
MKKQLSFLFALFLLINCEDPIDIELNDADEKLVVEAYINWIKERKQTEQVVNLSLSSPYFDVQSKPANGAVVTIEDDKGQVYRFAEQQNTGRYLAQDTIPYTFDQSFTLKIQYRGERYSASESLKSVSSIVRIDQDEIDFFGSASVELEAHCFDPGKERNFSYFEFISETLSAPEYNVYRDDFSNGNEYYGFLLSSDLKSGDQVRIRQYGLSNIGYNFWYLLILQNTQQGGPFQTTPVNLIGNIVNESNTDLNPFGFFRISEVSEQIYTIN